MEEGIGELTTTLTERELHELMGLLGWYAYLRWGNPTGMNIVWVMCEGR